MVLKILMLLIVVTITTYQASAGQDLKPGEDAGNILHYRFSSTKIQTARFDMELQFCSLPYPLILRKNNMTARIL